jgi:hypothetical protein
LNKQILPGVGLLQVMIKYMLLLYTGSSRLTVLQLGTDTMIPRNRYQISYPADFRCSTSDIQYFALLLACFLMRIFGRVSCTTGLYMLSNCHQHVGCLQSVFTIIFIYLLLFCENRGSSVGTETGCKLDDRGVGVWDSVGSRIVISQYSPDQLWGLLSPLSNAYR